MAPIATLTVRLSAQIAEFQSEFRDATKSAEKFASEFEGIATKAAAVGTFFGSIMADIAGSVARGLGSAIRDAVKFSSEFNNAFIGLGSVARAFGTDAGSATKAAKQLSSDGLLPLKDSAAGLKNLLASGFNLDQSTKLMNAFKDSAAFGRVGAISFGDAIRDATAGVKNGNSILVDNVGITKNLSQILKEAGFSAHDLSRATSDVSVRTALYNGILKEAAAFTGDASKLTQTYAGQVSRLETQYNNLLATIGDVITQNQAVAVAIGFVGDVVQDLTKWLGENKNGFNLVTDAVILIVKAMSAALSVIDLLQTGFAGLQVTFNETARAGLSMANEILTVASVAAHLRASLDPVFGDEWRKKALLADTLLLNVRTHMKGFEDATTDATDRSIRWGNALQTGVARLDGLVNNLEDARGKAVAFGESVNTPPKENGLFTGTAKDAKAAAKAIASIFDDIFDVTKKVEKLADKFNDAIQSMKDRINGLDLVAKAQLWIGALEETGGAAKVLADKALRKELADAIAAVEAKFGSLRAAGLEALEDIGQKAKQIVGRDLSGIVAPINAPESHGLPQNQFPISQAEKFIATVDKISDSFRRMGDAMGGVVGRVISGIGAMAESLGSLKGVIGGIESGFSNIVNGLSGIVSAGVEIGNIFRRLTATPEHPGGALSLSSGWLGDVLGTNTQGRQLVTAFATAQGGFDKLHDNLLRLRTDGEALWIALTQGVGKSNPVQARAAIENINNALANPNTPAANASAAGFMTRDELQALADKAKATYEFMRDSGKFTAADIAAAFEISKNAQIRAMDDISRASLDSANKQRANAQAIFDNLTSQIDSLQASIAGEAPEEFIGIVEANTRAQIDALNKKREETTQDIIEQDRLIAEATLGASLGLAVKTGEATVDAIAEALRNQDFHMTVRVTMDGLPSGVTFGGEIPEFGTGGIVRKKTLAWVGDQGPEAIVPLPQMQNMGGGGTAILEVDGVTLAEVLVPNIPGVVRRYGLA